MISGMYILFDVDLGYNDGELPVVANDMMLIDINKSDIVVVPIK